MKIYTKSKFRPKYVTLHLMYISGEGRDILGKSNYINSQGDQENDWVDGGINNCYEEKNWDGDEADAPLFQPEREGGIGSRGVGSIVMKIAGTVCLGSGGGGCRGGRSGGR